MTNSSNIHTEMTNSSNIHTEMTIPNDYSSTYKQDNHNIINI